jgi:hypothetical protein
METQYDYETSPTLAIFRAAEQADAAVDALRAAGVPAAAIVRGVLGPGRYQCEDCSLSEEGDGIQKGATIGGPIGAVIGFGLAAWLTGSGMGVLVGLAAAGAAGGAVLGGLVGAIARAHFDDDEAEWIDIPAERPAALVTVYTSGGRTRIAARVKSVLKQAGAIGFLDPSTPEADALLRASGAAQTAAA